MEKDNKEKKDSKGKKILYFLLGFIIVVAVVAIVGYLFEAFSGFPKGHDAYAHVSKLKFISDFFPEHRWYYQWANGMLFSGSYAPLFYLMGLPLIKLGIAIPNIIIIFCFLTLVFIGLGIFGFIYSMTKSFWGGILGSVIALFSFSIWTWAIEGAVYPRIMGGGLLVMTLWLVAAYVKSIIENPNKKSKGLLILAVLFLFLTMICHVLLAFVTWILIFFIVCFFPLPWKKRMGVFLSVFGFSFFLASFFYFPLLTGFLFGGSGVTFFGVIATVLPMPVSYAFNPEGIGYFVIPLLILSLIIYPILRSKKQKFSVSPARTVWPIIFGLSIFLFYAFIGYTGLSGRYYYINGFIPYSAAFLITIFSAIIFGSLFGFLIKGASRGKKIFLIVLTVLIISAQGYAFYSNYEAVKEVHVYDSMAEDSPEYRTQQIIDLPKEDYQHRFATIDAFQADWFSSIYKTPQTRHYYGQGILHPNWHFWLEQTLYTPENFPIIETKNALDWFSIKWFSVEDSIETQEYPSLENLRAASESRYLKEDDLELIDMEIYNVYLEVFENKEVKPILSANNSPNILYIGSEAGYYTFVHNLSFNNYGSEKLIPVRGKKYIDDYEILELYDFDALFLYNYDYHNQEKAYWLLDNYVKSGRGVILETWNSPDAPIKGGEVVNLPEPSPINPLDFDEIKEKWSFGSSQTHEVLEDIDLTKFSLASYMGYDWKMSTSTESGIRPWAETILAHQGSPLIVGGEYGSGRIIWSGFNFNYHINSNRNTEESKLLENMIEWVLQRKPGQETKFEVTFVNPDKREIEVRKETRGIMFRESYYPLWKATLEGANGVVKSDMLYAGPGLMYVPVPAETEYPLKVTLTFEYSWSEKIGYVFSGLALIVFILFLLEDKFAKKLRVSRIASGSSKKISGSFKKWWEKDDD